MMHAGPCLVADVGSMFSPFFILERGPKCLRGLMCMFFPELSIRLVAKGNTALEVFSFCGVITKLGCS